MDEEVQLPVAEPTADPVVEPTPQPGSEAQTNPEGEQPEPGKMIPIPQEKWRETQHQAREFQKLQREIQSRQSATPTPTYSQPAVPGPEAGGVDPGAQSAINAIAQAVKAEIAPQLGYLERYAQDQAITDVGSRPHATDLAKEIAEYYVDPALKALPVSERMDRAYKLALGENFERIMNNTNEQARTQGQDAAYQKIAEKQSAETVPARATPRSGESYTDQFENLEGDAQQAFYDKYRAQIWEESGLGKPRR